MQKFHRKITVSAADRPVASDCLCAHTGLSKGRVKDAMAKGAVTLRKTTGGARRRLRRATAALTPGDVLELYYDEELLQRKPTAARCLDDLGRYSVWYKPAGLMAQGTQYGDHCCLLRQVEIHFRPERAAFLVHRLDREAAGLMLVAHDKQAAARLSDLFSGNQISKHYRVRVRGEFAEKTGRIDLPLDGKPALSFYSVSDYDPVAAVTTLEVQIETGRLHQIRRHFELIGQPVLGDPQYGTGNKNTEGLQLIAAGLRFRCPFTGQAREYALDATQE